MKIAFFSDVHANLPALEAFFEDVALEHVDAIYCLGDLVGYNIWPNEVVDEIRKRQIPTLMGNHDEALLYPVSTKEEKTSNRGLTKAMVNDGNREYLINLPRHLGLSFVTKEKPFHLLLVHGSARSINDYMVFDYPEKEVLDMMRGHNADMLFCGHTHKPFHRIIKDGNRYRHIVNIGSVGKPKDGDPRSCYVVLELDQMTSSAHKESVRISFKRVNYALERAAKAVEQSGFPNAYAEALRAGQ